MNRPEARPSLGYYVAILALVVAVGAGVGLFALLTARDPGGAAAFIVSEAVAAPCPPGTGAPACYTFDVTNTGNQRGSANCTAVSAEGTTALFANDQPTSQVALLPNETREVYLKVVPTGSDVIRSPSLTCT